MTPGEVLADASVADFIRELGLGIAAAQAALDDNSVRQMEAFTARREDLGGRSLLDLGLVPAFYHYQHADITCSMQIRMEVGRSTDLGFSARLGVNDRESSGESSDVTETRSSSGSRTGVRRARLAMRADSAGALLLESGERFAPTGDDPKARLADLRRLLTADPATGIDTLIDMPPKTGPDIALNVATDKVVVKAATVAFLRPDSDNAAIRIRDNVDTDYVVNASLTVATTAQADVPAYAEHVRARFEAEGFAAALLVPGDTMVGPRYDTGVSALRPADAAILVNMAEVLKKSGLALRLEGFTDRQGSEMRNEALGTARAETVRAFLMDQGVPEGQLSIAPSRGEAEHAAEDPSGPEDNQDYRRTDLTFTDLSFHLVIVGNGPDIDPGRIAPDGTGDPLGPNNGYAVLFDQVPLSAALAGNGVTIDGTSFPFGGAANGAAAGAAASYANNLAQAINAAPDLSAWATGNVVRVARSGDSFDIQLFSRGEREIRVALASDFAITEQFARSRRSVTKSAEQENRAVAVGVSVSARHSRQFSLDVTGNSTISARLVSVPAPDEFMTELRAVQRARDA
jgi:outer membrane protein OmpA-like peptidoglycan-associated protein